MSLSRRSVLIGASGALLSTGTTAFAQGAPKAPVKIIVLTPRKDVGDVLGLRDYIASSGLRATIDVREVAQASAMPSLLPDIRAEKPDLVVTVFTPLTLATVGRYDEPDPDKFLTDVPVVFTSVTDPVASRIVRSLDQPGRPVTGTRHIAPMAVQVRTMLAYRRWKKIMTVYNPDESNMVIAVKELKEEAARQGIEVLDAALPRNAEGAIVPAAIPDLIRDGARDGAELVYIGPDTMVASNNNKLVADAALEHNLATFCSTELPIRRAKLLMGLVSPAVNVGRFAGLKAFEILANAKPPESIPVETLSRFSLLLRIEAAKRLDLYPSMRLLNIAEIVQDT
jgi:putative ABC transport system substrate-binding protein